jgi:ATP-dependent DNA ligase
MLAKPVDALPANGDFLYEPKWDGFRAIVFRGSSDVYIQSRDLKPLDRYFPDLHDSLLRLLPRGCVVDGEIVIATPQGLDFDALQLRLHPAQSRVAKLARETPASFVAFDVLAVDDRDVTSEPLAGAASGSKSFSRGASRRCTSRRSLATTASPCHGLPQFEGAGLDGVVAKPVDLPYQPGKRAMLKVKHVRTADCVVAGFRWYKNASGAVGSLLLGLYDEAGVLHHVGVTSAFTMAMRKALAAELAPLSRNALATHPWRDWAEADGDAATRMPGGSSRWSAGKDLSVGAAAPRASLRGEVRSSAGRPVSARDAVPALAQRQTARRLSLRPARGHAALRAR